MFTICIVYWKIYAVNKILPVATNIMSVSSLTEEGAAAVGDVITGKMKVKQSIELMFLNQYVPLIWINAK